MSEEEIEKEREECDSTTKLMILLGEMAGCGAYDAHQHIHCQCVEKGKVEENMERVLRAFYEEYNPDAVDKGGFVVCCGVVWCGGIFICCMLHCNDAISHANFPLCLPNE